MEESRSAFATIAERIVLTPGTCGGRPRVDRTRIRVQDIYHWHEVEGKSPDEIVHLYPQLTMADVYAALSYFWAHRDELLADMESQRIRYEQLKAVSPSLLSEKLSKLGQGNASNDPLSP